MFREIRREVREVEKVFDPDERAIPINKNTSNSDDNFDPDVWIKSPLKTDDKNGNFDPDKRV